MSQELQAIDEERQTHGGTDEGAAGETATLKLAGGERGGDPNNGLEWSRTQAALHRPHELPHAGDVEGARRLRWYDFCCTNPLLPQSRRRFVSRARASWAFCAAQLREQRRTYPLRTYARPGGLRYAFFVAISYPRPMASPQQLRAELTAPLEEARSRTSYFERLILVVIVGSSVLLGMYSHNMPAADEVGGRLGSSPTHPPPLRRTLPPDASPVPQTRAIEGQPSVYK